MGARFGGAAGGTNASINYARNKVLKITIITHKVMAVNLIL